MDDIYMELYEKLSRLQWLLHRHHLRNHAAQGPMADPTRGQGRVLALLKMQSEISTKELSYLLGIRQQSLNELLNKLEKSGYVTRVPAEKDRRVMLVRLTEKGRDEQQAETDLSGVFNCLDAEEQATFDEYLERIITALETSSGDDKDTGIQDWMEAARKRMGDERFDCLMSMRRRFSGMRDCSHRHDCNDREPKPYDTEDT